MASPGRTEEILSGRRMHNKSAEEGGEVVDGDVSPVVFKKKDSLSHEGSLPTSTCKSDMDEFQDHHGEVPRM